MDDDWKSIVLAQMGEGECSSRFISEVGAHLGNFRELEKYFEKTQSLALTKRDVEKIHSYAGELMKYFDLLTEKLDTPNYTVTTMLTIGLTQDQSNGIDGRDTLQFLSDFSSDLLEIRSKTNILATGSSSALEFMSDDPMYNDVRYNSRRVRKSLVRDICRSYTEVFDRPATAGSSAFYAILESILESNDLPASNIHRLLKESLS